MTRLFCTALLLSTALGACASSGGLGETKPIVDADGVTGQQRNLLLDDLSYGSPGRGSAINETFDLMVTSFAVSPDAGGAASPGGTGVQGLIRGSATSEGFGAGNTLEFYADSGLFVFDVDTEAGVFSQTFLNILLDDPVPLSGAPNYAVARLYGSNPTVGFSGGVPIGFADAYPIPGVTPADSVGAINAALDALAETDEDYLADIVTAANNIFEQGDAFGYAYALPNGTGFFEPVNMTGSNGITDSVTAAEYSEYYSDGSEQHGFLVYGHRTPLAEMPTAGTASFEGKVVGDVLTNNAVRSLTGSVTMDVDFLSGSLDFWIGTIIREGGNNEGATTFIPYKELSGTGVISDTIFAGDLFEIDGDATGEFDGAFFGPVANEAGGTFRFGNDSSYATGAFTAKQKSGD